MPGSSTSASATAGRAWQPLAAADATTSDLDAHQPLLLCALIDHTDKDITSPLPGLIQGHAGVALTLDTIADAIPGGWSACLLID